VEARLLVVFGGELLADGGALAGGEGEQEVQLAGAVVQQRGVASP
jgi:hypothetical protein